MIGTTSNVNRYSEFHSRPGFQSTLFIIVSKVLIWTCCDFVDVKVVQSAPFLRVPFGDSDTPNSVASLSYSSDDRRRIVVKV